jgi:hypothetical protein
LCIGFIEIAFCETEVIDGIQKVGFTLAIGTTNGCNPLFKGKFGGRIVPKLK